jgi:uncharacterized phage protein (TIGR02218 family)
MGAKSGMSYEIHENSVCDGSPVELYRFVYDIQRWNWTSGNLEQTWLSETYTPEPIKRGEFALNRDPFSERLDLEVPRDNEVAALWIAFPPERQVTLTVFRGHQGDNDFRLFWQGRVITPLWPGDGTCKLACEPIKSQYRRIGAVKPVQRTCPHALYERDCWVNKESFKVSGTVSAVDGVSISGAAFATKADGWFVSGHFNVGLASRMILAHSGTAITIAAPIAGLAVGNSFDAYAGCDHTRPTCKTTFSNNLNYGGYDYWPERNPFKGDAVM